MPAIVGGARAHTVHATDVRRAYGWLDSIQTYNKVASHYFLATVQNAGDGPTTNKTKKKKSQHRR
jgi:hypothetical protein